MLKDADIELASTMAVKSRLLNSGQVCISAKRFIVDLTVYDEFVEKVINKCEKFVIGDPLNE